MPKILVVRIKEKGHFGKGSYQYKNEINLEDFKQLATLLIDLETYGGKIDKAFLEYSKNKTIKEWPFE